MSRELAADPIQMSDDDDTEALFSTRRSTREKSTKKVATPIAMSVNKQLLQRAQSKNQRMQPMRKNPVSFEDDVNENDDASDDEHGQWQGRKQKSNKAAPVNDVDTPIKSTKKKKMTSSNGNGSDRAAESSGSATTTRRRRATKQVIVPDPDDNDDSNSDGVLHNPTSRRPSQSRGAKKPASPPPQQQEAKKRIASSLFDDSPVTGKRHAATVAASAVAAAIDDDDDSGPLELTAKLTIPDDSDDSDDFQSARERRESSGGSGRRGAARGTKPRAKPSPKDQDKIDRHKRAVELKKQHPDIAKARVTAEDDWLAGSLASMLSNAPAHKADEPQSSPAAAVAQKTPAVAPKASAKFLDNDDDSSPSHSQAIVTSPAANVPVVARTTTSEAPPPFLPEHRNGIDVNALLQKGACLVAIDGVLSGATKSARMDAFEKGGRSRRDLSQTLATGYFSHDNVKTLLDALQKRYVTEANIERFSGNLNVMRVIGDVLLSELVVELMRLACGETITREKALYYVEHPIVSDAERARAIAEARASRSRIRR